MSEATMLGVWAKWERALEQLQALHKELLEFGQQPNAYTVTSQMDINGEHYIFWFDPAWPATLTRRWGAIIGEIVHDLRSALDQLVWQLVILNDTAPPSEDHSFPIRTVEPEQGFAVETRRQWTDRRKRARHGPLFGISDDALALIDSCQPYHGGDAALLGELHALWNTDKHRTLIPMMMVAEEGTITVNNAIIRGREPSRFEGKTYIVEFTVARTGLSDPHVDVDPPRPRDIAFHDGRAIIEELRRIGAFVLERVLIPASEMFPEGSDLP